MTATKSLCLLFSTVLVVLLLVFSSEAYEYVFSDADLERIFSNKRLLEANTKCYLDIGPCPKPAREAKKSLREVFETNCSKCSKAQKKQVKLAFKKLRQIKQQDFEKIFEKYNPGNTHRESFLKWLESKDN